MAPRRLIADAGFENLVPRHPIYELIDVDRTLGGIVRFLISRRSDGRNGTLLQFLKKVVPALPTKYPTKSEDIWDMDHAGAMMGMLNEGFVRANCEAFKELIESCDANIIVDFWNPFAVLSARAIKKPIVTVIQANAHPDSGGFIWWRARPPNVPTPVSVMNRVLADYGLPPITRLADLSIGDLTLVVGAPETDPLPETADVRYVGAIPWESENATLPEWINALSGNKPVVWVYSGNPQFWRPQQRHPCASTASARQPRPDQIAIARGTASPQLPAGSFPEGFRTTAPVPAALSSWVVIRNPYMSGTLSRPFHTAPLSFLI